MWLATISYTEGRRGVWLIGAIPVSVDCLAAIVIICSDFAHQPRRLRLRFKWNSARAGGVDLGGRERRGRGGRRIGRRVASIGAIGAIATSRCAADGGN